MLAILGLSVKAQLPPAPTGLTATPVSSSQINISWNSVSGATEYEVDYGVGSCPWAAGGIYLTHTYCNACTTATATGLNPSTTYRFIVLAKNSYGWGTTYNCVSATTLSAICSITSLNPSSETYGPASFSTTPGADDIIVNAQPNCTYSVTGVCTSWLSVTPLSGTTNGNGQAFLNYTIQANTTTSTRSCTFYVNGSPFTITQNGCTYDFSPNTKNVSASGLTYGLDIDTDSPCSWSISNPCSSWVSLSQSSGTGYPTISVTVDPNTACSTRTCTLTISPGNATHVITQQGNSPPPAPTAGNNGPVCVGSTLSLTASNISGATYSWTGPNGFTSTQQNPTVSSGVINAMAGIYNVTATVNGCTSSAGSTTVTVNPLPTPSISVNGNTLTCNPSYQSYQWYYNGNSVGNTQTITCVGNGNYYVSVTDNNSCTNSSNTSPVSGCTVGISEKNSDNNFAIFPNPTTGTFTLSFAVTAKQNIKIDVLNNIGQMVYTETKNNFNGKYSKTIDLRGFSNGVYMINTQIGDKVFTNKVTVQ